MGISWKRYPQLPMCPRYRWDRCRGFHELYSLLPGRSGIDSRHWMSVHWKYLFYEISCRWSPLNECTLQVPFIWNPLYYIKPVLWKRFLKCTIFFYLKKPSIPQCTGMLSTKYNIPLGTLGQRRHKKIIFKNCLNY